MKSIVLIGAGGHCKSVIDVIESTSLYKIVAIVDKKENVGKTILNYTISHTDEDLALLVKKYKKFLITVGQIKTPDPRIHLYHQIVAAGGHLETIVSNRAYVSKYATIGAGTVVMHDALVNAQATIEDNCIINSKALVEHDAIVHSHSHISTSAVLNGAVIVGEGSFIGSKAVIRENLEIQPRSIIPAGFAVLKRPK